MNSLGQEEYKYLSQRAKLLLSGQENKIVDFKREIKKLRPRRFCSLCKYRNRLRIRLVGVVEKDGKII